MPNVYDTISENVYDTVSTNVYDALPTSTATTPEPSLSQTLTANLSSGDPARIATAFLPLTTASNQALEVGLDQANKMQEDKAIAQAVTAEQPPKSTLELAERNRQLQRQFYGTPDPPQEGIPGGDFTGILPRPDGRLGALLRTGGGVEKAIAGGIVGTEELIEGIANYMTTEQGALELGLSKTPVAPFVFFKWAKDMVQGGMVNVKDAADAYEKKDWERFGKNVVVGFGQLAGAGMAGRHGVKSGAKAITSKASEFIPRGQGIASPDLARLAPETAKAVATPERLIPETEAATVKPTSNAPLAESKDLPPERPLASPEAVVIPDYDPNNIGKKATIQIKKESGLSHEEAVLEAAKETEQVRKWVDDNTFSGDVVQTKDGALFFNDQGNWVALDQTGITSRPLGELSMLRGGKVIRRGLKQSEANSLKSKFVKTQLEGTERHDFVDKPEPTPGGGMSTKSPEDQARHELNTQKMRAESDFAKEVAAVEDLRGTAPERSVLAAWKHPDGTIEKGEAGEIHVQIGKISEDGFEKIHPNTGKSSQAEAGFITNNGRFVTRYEAYRLGLDYEAKIINAKQSNPPTPPKPKPTTNPELTSTKLVDKPTPTSPSQAEASPTAISTPGPAMEGKPVSRDVGDLGKLVESKDTEATPRELPAFSIPSKSKLSGLKDLPFTEPQKEIITRLNELGFDPNVTVVSDPRIPAAAYNGSSGIILNAAKLHDNPHLAVRGIVHEAVHDATHAAIRNPSNQATVARLGELMSYAMKTYYRNRTKFGGESSALDHAFKNLDEFVTGAFTSGRVRKVFSEMAISERTGVKPTEGKATVFGKFMELVSDLLGIRGRRTLLEEVVKSGEELIKSRTKSESPISFDATKLNPVESGLSYSETRLASDWTSATESIKPLAPESGTIGKPPEFPKIEPQELGAGVSLPQFKIRKMTPLDVATAQHSAKMQRSESNARRAVKEIRKLAKNENRQSAIAIWVEAAGDVPTLQGWASASRGKKFKQAATAAQNLTPEEITLGRKVRAAFDALYAKGTANDVVTNFRDNYITHIWERPGRKFGFGSGTLKQNFKFNKARTFATFFEGDQAGFTPKTLALDRIVPAYIKEMDSVIAARQFVKDMAGQLASDGRPLVIPRGSAKEVTGAAGDATLVFPKALKNVRDEVGNKVDQSDYKTMDNQPALQKWSWVAEDQAGNPIMLQADLSLHPEALKRIHSMLGTSALTEWYRQPSTGAAQIPRAIVKGLDAAQSEMKRSMFGMLAPFHQVQEGTHAIGHTVNPFFGIPKVDLRNPAQLDAAAHGLMMLPDRASSASYLEGSGSQSSLIVKGMKKVPGLKAIGEASDMYQDYLFHQYIPGLKFKTYEHILERNTKRYQPELASGEVTIKDVKLLSAEQSNAAYGHLNYALIDRNPTIQHFLRLAALAPDFLEARGRFTGQAVKGLSGKVGQEQLRAIAFLAAAQAGSALVLSQLLGVPYDPHHPFEVVYNGRRYAMRSVPEDIFGFVKDTRRFSYSRINPLIAKGGIQYVTGLNYRGEKVTAGETTAELLAGYIPITARSIPALRGLTFTDRNQPVSPLEQLAGSIGLRISRYSPISETYKLAHDWQEKQKMPTDRGSYPVSKYQQLRYALEDNDTDGAVSAYQDLLKTMTAAKIESGFKESINHPFTSSKANDEAFSESLKGYDRELYDLAVQRRKDIVNRFRLMPKTAPQK